MRAPTKHSAYTALVERQVPVGTVLDVGIHHCTPELMRFFPTMRHVLFEPVAEFKPKILELYKNIDFELHQVAVSDSSGTAQLKKFSKTESGAITHSSIGIHSAAAETVSVPKIKLDEFLPNRCYERPYLLKIDVDGFEQEVLAGARDTLQHCSIVIVECAGNTLVHRARAVIDAGFVLFDLAEPCYYDNAFWQCDAIFVRRDLHQKYFAQLGKTVDSNLYQSFKLD